VNRQRQYFGLFLAAVVLVVAPRVDAPGLALHAAQVASEPETTYYTYFPVVFNDYPPVLFGRVTQAGAPAAAVSINLRFYTGSAWMTLATVTTGADGVYRFASPPVLAAGQKYLAAFDNNTQANDRLAWWTTPELTYYASTTIRLGDFDIAAIQLDQPANDSSVGLPASFRWSRRAATTSDSYALRLCDWSDFNPMYVSSYLGYVDNFSLNSLLSGFSAGTTYSWDVLVRGPDGGQGASRQPRGVKLMPGLFGRVTQAGGAAGNVLLQLRYFNGATWSTRASTTTSGDGVYLFDSVPSLAAGQQYYVRYENVTQTTGRLFLWGTRSLTAYTIGSSLDMGSFDIADIPLVNPPGGATIGLPYMFQWTRRTATSGDSYLIEVYAPDNFEPRWLSPLVGYAEAYVLSGLPGSFPLHTTYAWDVVVASPDGGSGVSRMARLVTFSTGVASDAAIASWPWPFPEDLPARPKESYDTGQ
jgi:hypothetical protein